MLKYAETTILGESSSTTANLLSSLARETNTYIVGGSIPELSESKDGKIFNTCLCFDRTGAITA